MAASILVDFSEVNATDVCDEVDVCDEPVERVLLSENVQIINNLHVSYRRNSNELFRSHEASS